MCKRLICFACLVLAFTPIDKAPAGVPEGTILVGWHTPDSGNPVSDDTPDDYFTGVTGLLSNGEVREDGESTDGDYGSGPDEGSTSNRAIGVRESSFGPAVLVQITNSTGGSLNLGTFHFDYSRWFNNSPKDVALYYDSGDLTDLEDTLINSVSDLPVLGKAADYDDFDWSLSVLSDVTLANGESATFRLEVSNYASNNTSGAFDNIAITKGTPSDQAWGPSPIDEAIDVPWNGIVLMWEPSEFAGQHDVYFGTDFDSVNDATNLDPMGPDNLYRTRQGTTSFTIPEELDFGQTYYWRVDEVNGAPDNTVFKGNVWSFEVEPFSIPVTNIIATASSSHDADMVPERTIDGSGLDALDQHSNQPQDMWLSGMGDPVPFIQYEFDKAYKLHEMWIWNSNQSIESFVGLGAKDVTVEISTNGTDWIQLEDVPPFAQASGQMGYAHNTTIDLGGAIAQYVRLTINAGHGMVPQYSLSEVRFLYIPTNAREPQPLDGAVTDTVDVVLHWRAGREAVSHEVYLGTDSADLALVQTVDENSAAIGPLDYGATYYWQIVEVNNAQDPSSHASDVWSLSTPAFGTVDSFDLYDDDCNRIFFAWLDGLGHNGGQDIDGCDVPSYNGNGTGSIVGHANSPFAEQTIVFAGRQSMPLEYDSGVSETTIALDAQDWTAAGIQSLSLYFRGAPGNTGQLYVKINNTRVVYEGLPDALQRQQWVPWNIELGPTGANIGNVTSLTLGIENATGLGMIYLDEIRVYPQVPELIIPVEPTNANLVARYGFDGNANDSVGGLHGTLVGDATFAPGQQGQALSINTLSVTDYVEITGYQGILGTSAITVSAWVKTDSDATGAIIGWGPNVGGQRFGFRVDAGRLRTEHHGGNIQGDTVMNDGNWHHVAVTIQANATVSYPEVQLWLDGLDDTRRTTDADPPYDIQADQDVSIGRRPASDDRHFIGQIDELYIYDRALSPAEIAWLAGLTQPISKAF